MADSPSSAVDGRYTSSLQNNSSRRGWRENQAEAFHGSAVRPADVAVPNTGERYPMTKKQTPRADIDDTATWVKYTQKLCHHCIASCCRLPVEVTAADLVRMEVVDSFELEEEKYIARRLIKEKIVEHYHGRTQTFVLARMANGDCLYLDSRRRRCRIYDKRPKTCRDHPRIGPRPGFCAFRPQPLGRRGKEETTMRYTADDNGRW